MKTIKIKWMVLMCALSLASCDKMFEYNPYSAEVPVKMKNTTEKELSMIETFNSESPALSEFKIAFISDSHLNFDDLDDAVEAINKDDEILFTVHCGDMTDGGMLAEYLIFRNIAEKLHHPYLTVIGNHDCLANGELIYESMFGPLNYTLEFRGNKFIFFNDIIWELNNREPEFLWLKDELSDANNYHHVFVMTHIPPWSDQYSPFQTFAYKTLMNDSGVNTSIHGHHHNAYSGSYFNDNINYLVVGSVDNRGYYELTVKPDTCLLRRINY